MLFLFILILINAYATYCRLDTEALVNFLVFSVIRNVQMRVKIKIDPFGYFYWLSIRKWSR